VLLRKIRKDAVCRDELGAVEGRSWEDSVRPLPSNAADNNF